MIIQKLQDNYNKSLEKEIESKVKVLLNYT